MENEGLRIAWVCNDCNTVFIFPDDVEIHEKISLHSSFSIYDMDSGRMLEKGQEQGMKRLSKQARDELR